MKVIYDGQSDFQIFEKRDFDKVEGDLGQGKVTFPKGEPVEVTDAAGEALLAKDGIFGDFEFKRADDDAQTEADKGPEIIDANAGADGGAEVLTGGPDATTQGTAVPGRAGNVGRGSTGRGNTTAGGPR